MRSRLLERWFGQGAGGGVVPAKRRATTQAAASPDKGRPAPPAAAVRAKPVRLCLGIGDGSVHRQ